MARILIVEDEEQVRVLAEAFIQDLGHTTLTAGNLKEATAILEDVAQTIDVLFVDVNLSDEAQSGIAVAKYARLGRPSIRVIYTTGGGVNDGTRALFVDPYVYLGKPYTPDQLRVAVENAMAGNT